MPIINVINDNAAIWLKKNPKKTYDFIFADPPFNIGQTYEGYLDKVSQSQYEAFTYNWISQVFKHSHGITALHGNDKLCELYIRTIHQQTPFSVPRSAIKRIAWIIWNFNFSICRTDRWPNSHAHTLVYSSLEKWTWNPDDVLIPSARAEQYNDKRADPNSEEYEGGGERVPGDVWGSNTDGQYWGRVQGNSRERRPDHPNQIPEVYMERLIKAYTNEGDTILDPFGGSGTTAVVAQALNRNCDTIDISAKNCDSIRRRLQTGAVRVSKL